jgi:MFS family permease
MIEKIPVWGLFVGTVLLVMVAHEIGHRLGTATRGRPEEEVDSATGAIAGAILGLIAFMLAFTFGMAADRFDTRKALVREEANAIGTAYLRTDFLPEPGRSESVRLFRAYVDHRVSAVQKGDPAALARALAEAPRIHEALWSIAVANAKTDMNSDIGALYVESLNEVVDLNRTRLNVGVQVRIPGGIWGILFGLIGVGLVTVGYHAAIAGSRRSWVTVMLGFSLALVIGLIAALDRPQAGIIKVSQQPLIDVRDMIVADPRSR